MSESSLISPEEVWRFLLEEDIHIIDVRAPIEFTAGRIPPSVNCPILNDEERALVGTTYKQEGSEYAIALGHKLVQGEVKAKRIAAWIHEIAGNQKTVVTCFRGGLRSKIAQQWLAEAGWQIPRIAGGYKKMRQLFLGKIESFCGAHQMWILTGKTGSGKTRLLPRIQSHPTLNLEFLAKHRGSAFGAYREAQPGQVDFENILAVELGKLSTQAAKKSVIVEDESRLIGRCVQPERFFEKLRGSPVLFLEESLETRIENIFQEYVALRSQEPGLFQDLDNSLAKIKNKLGGLRYAEISSDMEKARLSFRDHADLSPSRVWIEKLIRWYYDPMYESSFQKRNPKVLIRGDRDEILRFLDSATTALTDFDARK